MNRWKVWMLSLGSAALALTLALSPNSGDLGRQLTTTEMSCVTGGGPPNGTKCTNECNGALNVACSGVACWVPGGNISPGDRCQGGTGGGGSVYNCINLGVASATHCTLQGADATCTPTTICRWGELKDTAGCPLGILPQPGNPLGNKRWGVTCVGVANTEPVSGKSSCVNI